MCCREWIVVRKSFLVDLYLLKNGIFQFLSGLMLGFLLTWCTPRGADKAPWSGFLLFLQGLVWK